MLDLHVSLHSSLGDDSIFFFIEEGSPLTFSILNTKIFCQDVPGFPDRVWSTQLNCWVLSFTLFCYKACTHQSHYCSKYRARDSVDLEFWLKDYESRLAFSFKTPLGFSPLEWPGLVPLLFVFTGNSLDLSTQHRSWCLFFLKAKGSNSVLTWNYFSMK